MCDQKSFADMDRYLERVASGSAARHSATLYANAKASLQPSESSATALEVVARDVDVPMPEGSADAHFVHPTGGPHPGVLIWPDAFGLRPTMRQMARRLAESGYAVLVVNPYYRIGRAPLPPEGSDFNDDKTRAEMMELIGSLTPDRQRTDASAYVDYLDAQSSVDAERPLGTMGYCMGGPITVRTAATRPDRIGAGASFHGGGLVTGDAASPHRLVPELAARFLIAIAENDHAEEPEARDVLRQAFAERGLHAEIEVYEGALHGWCPPDMPVYHEALAERAWSRLLVLFEGALQ